MPGKDSGTCVFLWFRLTLVRRLKRDVAVSPASSEAQISTPELNLETGDARASRFSPSSVHSLQASNKTRNVDSKMPTLLRDGSIDPGEGPLSVPPPFNYKLGSVCGNQVFLWPANGR